MKYIGNELELFSHATHWKAYWSKIIKSYVNGHVLEVGTGIGSSTLALSSCNFKSWTCLEPDPELAERLVNIVKEKTTAQYKVVIGTLMDINPGESYDTILYIDVLEHIKDDLTELENATKFLSDNGTVIILGPAHQWLFSEFDSAIGHFRRYNKKMLMNIIPEELHLIKIIYLDSVGLFASLGNRFMLRKPVPDKKEIEFWDNIMVPCSRVIDLLLFYRFGKSIIGVWQRRKK